MIIKIMNKEKVNMKYGTLRFMYSADTCRFVPVKLLSVLVVLLLSGMLQQGIKAQSVRGLVNDGVDSYKKKKYTDSEVNFRKGLEKAPDNFNAYFNLGDAQYKQGRFDEALKTYNQALTKTKDNELKAKTYHNIGNALLKSKKLEESIAAYKKALKIKPDDMETKYNLSYALNMLKENENKQNNKDQNKDQKNNQQNQQNQNNQNKDNQDKNKNQDQDKNNQDQNKQDQQNNQNNEAKQDNTRQNNQKQQDNPGQGKQEKNKISEQEAERILNALKNNELDLQKKLRKKEGVRVRTDKDW